MPVPTPMMTQMVTAILTAIRTMPDLTATIRTTMTATGAKKALAALAATQTPG
jgi:hypothetical protein